MSGQRQLEDRFCGAAETLASYIDGGLTKNERARYEAHLAECERCLAELVAAKAELDEAGREGWLHPARAERPRAATRIARLLKLLLPPRAGRSGELQAASSLCAAALLAAALVALMRSPGWDPDFLEGRSGARRILATADVGEMRLAGGRAAPRDTASMERGVTGFDPALLERSIVSLERSRERHPGDWRSYALLADLSLAAGRIREAEDLYGRALELRPGEASLLNDLGVAAYRAGDPERSLELFESAYRIDPRSEEAVYNLVLLNRDLGRAERAERYLRLYLELDGSSPWSRRLQAPPGP